jgi:hypothetical protein
LFGGYEHITKSNPDNPLLPGAGIIGGYAVGFVNNNNFLTSAQIDIGWVGVKYAITPTLDIAAAYYHFGQGFFLAGAGSTGAASGGVFAYASRPGVVANATQAAACAANSTASTGCAGAEDMVGVALDWRFARHVDFYAGVAYSQRYGGPANAFITSTANGTLGGAGCATGTAPCNLNNRVSTFDPGIGLRYQF